MSVQVGQRVDRADMAALPEGTLIEREDGQLWQRVDNLLTSWRRIWGDEDAPRADLYPARVVWMPKTSQEEQ